MKEIDPKTAKSLTIGPKSHHPIDTLVFRKQKSRRLWKVVGESRNVSGNVFRRSSAFGASEGEIFARLFLLQLHDESEFALII